MARYMIVAHQTATSPHLMERLRDIAERDADAHFTLVVPETPVSHLLLEDVLESRDAAQATAAEAERVMRAAELPLVRVTVGNASPIAAIEDELRFRPDYDAVVISTLRPGASRWLELDIHHRVHRRLSLPVIHVCEGGDAAWAGRSRVEAVPIPPPTRSRRPAPEPRNPMRAARWPVVIGLMLLYLALTLGLALGVNQTFFLVDAIAIVMFTVLLAGVWFVERTRARA